MKPLIVFSVEHWEALLKRTTEDSPLYSRLKNAAKTEAGTIEVLCDLDEAEMLLHMAKSFCPEAVPEIEKAIRLVQRVLNSGNLSVKSACPHRSTFEPLRSPLLWRDRSS